MENKFNQDLLEFAKKQLPDDVISKYERLYNLYANKEVEFISEVYTLEMYLESILEEVITNCALMNKDNIREILKDDINLLNLSLNEAEKNINSKGFRWVAQSK